MKITEVPAVEKALAALKRIKVPLWIKNLSPEMKDRALCAAWIGGLLLAGLLPWGLSARPRAMALREQLNSLLFTPGRALQLGEPPRRHDLPPASSRMGVWYPVVEDQRQMALVFPLRAGGGFIPCAALTGEDGLVLRLFSLTSWGEKALSRQSRGVIFPYLRRIEAGAYKKGSARTEEAGE